MKATHLSIGLIALAAFLFTGCLSREMRSDHQVFSAQSVTAPGDTISGNVVAEIEVCSSESWSAEVLDADWVSLDRKEYLNPTGIEQTVVLKATLQNNDSNDPRKATVRFYSANGVRQGVTITQRGKVNRLQLDGESSLMVPAEPSEPLVLNILSNTEWTVSLSDKTTSEVFIDKLAGSHNGQVSVTFAPNYEIHKNLETGIVISAPGTEPVNVTITQEGNEPFIRMKEKTTKSSLLPIDEEGVLSFHANSSWTAEALPGATIEGFSISEKEGPAGEECLVSFSADENKTDEPRTAQVKISLKDYPEAAITVDILQRGGIALMLDFREMITYDDCPLQPYSSEDLEIPMGQSSPGTGLKGINNFDPTIHSPEYDPHGPYKYKYEQAGKEYVFEICNDPYSINKKDSGSDGYIQFGKGYLKLPAIEGYRLSALQLFGLASGKLASVTTDPKGENRVENLPQMTIPKDSYGQWVFTQTEPNTSYYLWHPSRTNNRWAYILLIYEK